MDLELIKYLHTEMGECCSKLDVAVRTQLSNIQIPDNANSTAVKASLTAWEISEPKVSSEVDSSGDKINEQLLSSVQLRPTNQEVEDRALAQAVREYLEDTDSSGKEDLQRELERKGVLEGLHAELGKGIELKQVSVKRIDEMADHIKEEFVKDKEAKEAVRGLVAEVHKDVESSAVALKPVDDAGDDVKGISEADQHNYKFHKEVVAGLELNLTGRTSAENITDETAKTFKFSSELKEKAKNLNPAPKLQDSTTSMLKQANLHKELQSKDRTTLNVVPVQTHAEGIHPEHKEAFKFQSELKSKAAKGALKPTVDTKHANEDLSDHVKADFILTTQIVKGVDLNPVEEKPYENRTPEIHRQYMEEITSNKEKQQRWDEAAAKQEDTSPELDPATLNSLNAEISGFDKALKHVELEVEDTSISAAKSAIKKKKDLEEASKNLKSVPVPDGEITQAVKDQFLFDSQLKKGAAAIQSSISSAQSPKLDASLNTALLHNALKSDIVLKPIEKNSKDIHPQVKLDFQFHQEVKKGLALKALKEPKEEESGISDHAKSTFSLHNEITKGITLKSPAVLPAKDEPAK